jgi:hypothetical protein
MHGDVTVSEPIYRKWKTATLTGSQRIPSTFDFSQEYQGGYEPNTLIISPTVYAALGGPPERLRAITQFVLRQP